MRARAVARPVGRADRFHARLNGPYRSPPAGHDAPGGQVSPASRRPEADEQAAHGADGVGILVRPGIRDEEGLPGRRHARRVVIRDGGVPRARQGVPDQPRERGRQADAEHEEEDGPSHVAHRERGARADARDEGEWHAQLEPDPPRGDEAPGQAEHGRIAEAQQGEMGDREVLDAQVRGHLVVDDTVQHGAPDAEEDDPQIRPHCPRAHRRQPPYALRSMRSTRAASSSSVGRT